jgi:hypothetical protein
VRPDLRFAGRVNSSLPVDIYGESFSYRDPMRLSVLQKRRERKIRVSWDFHSEIWLPWVRTGLALHPWGASPPASPILSYNLLAREHTPRLNRYLSGIKALTGRVDGSWELAAEDSGFIAPTCQFMLDADGVLLDAPLPARYLEAT